MTKFVEGQSGNPSGRPKGIPDRRTIFREMIEPHREALVQKAIALALDGNEQMLRLLLDRLLPAKPKIEEESFDGFNKDKSLSEQLVDIKQAMSNGEISSDYAHKASQVIATQIKIDEYMKITQLEQRVEEIMKQLPQLQNQNLTSIEFKEEEVKDKQT